MIIYNEDVLKMGELVFIEDNRVVTDSLMVAEVFNKSHNKVMRDVRVQLDKLKAVGEKEFSLSNFGQSKYTNERGREYTKYLLTEDAFTLVTMSYNTDEAMKFKVKYINEFNRMKELIGSENSRLPSSFAEALRLAADQHEQIEEMKPKVESFKMFIDGSNYQKMNDVAKSLGYGRNKLFAFLRSQKVLMKDNVPYQRFIESGYFVVKETSIERYGRIYNNPQTYVTSKGVDYIGKMLRESGILLSE